MALLKSKRSKVAVAIAVAFIILIGGVFGYIELLLAGKGGLINGAGTSAPSISGYINNQGLLSYNNGRFEVPYVSVAYDAPNALVLNAEGGIYAIPPPTHLYIFNYSGGCFKCGNDTTLAIRTMINGIKSYGMNGLYANITNVSAGQLDTIQNDSILVIVTGLIPSSLAANNFSLMETLLAKKTSILYVGLNFSSAIVPGVVPSPIPVPRVPPFLAAYPVGARSANIGFTFRSPTWLFLQKGQVYHRIAYKNVGNGSIAAFPNTLSSWPSEQAAGADLAKAIQLMFWLPRYAYGNTTSIVPRGGIGDIGIAMLRGVNDTTYLLYNTTLPQTLSKGYLRIAIQATPSRPGAPSAYTYITSRPAMNTRGVVSMPSNITPNESGVKITFNITSAPVKPTRLSTFIRIFNQNLVPTGWDEQGPSISNFSSASQTSFYNYYNLGLGPGHYIMMLTNFSDNTELAAGYFVIPPYVVIPTYSNFTSGIFIFRITSGGQPVDEVGYNLTVNRLYNASGVVRSGVVSYKLPTGVLANGPQNFTFRMLGQNFSYTVSKKQFPFRLNPQYVELGVVIIMMVIMVAFVKAPIRDEFYIDVPNLPEAKKLEIKLKANDVISVFEKLNANYHWKYMPLSKSEAKSAIAVNIKYKNIPVELTYSNIDAILDSLLVNGYIVGADDLFAPASWLASSKHDIGYLATFKKLRIYFVTHSYGFTDIDISDEADILATIHGDRKYVVIYSESTKFKNIPLYPGFRTYLAFLNSDVMEEFMTKLYNTSSEGAEKLKMYISADFIRLIDADNPGKTME